MSQLNSFNLPFIPTLYPDEILISHYSRFAALAAQNDADNLRQILNGKSTDRLRVELFERYLNALLRENFTIDELFKQSSVEAMELAAGRSFGPLTKKKSILSIPSKYRYCLSCVAKDLTAHHEPYYRRYHQVPGVLVCDIHQTMLVELSGPSRQKRELIAPTLPIDINLNNPSDRDCSLLSGMAMSARLATQITLPRVNGYESLRTYLSSLIVYQVQSSGVDSEFIYEMRTILRERRSKISYIVATILHNGSSLETRVVRSKRRVIEDCLPDILMFGAALGASKVCGQILSGDKPTSSDLWIKNPFESASLVSLGVGEFDAIIPMYDGNHYPEVEYMVSLPTSAYEVIDINNHAPNARGTRIHGVPIIRGKSFLLLRFGSQRAPEWGRSYLAGAKRLTPE